ncbi:MAG: phosphatidate cytidylyltransferase, partial [Pseudomonadales bacterium]|nr:phosphatidate cytidylyltransferase [Pseudomonadales bacterium]
MLKQRIITALILVPIVLGAIFFLPNHWFALALALPVLLGASEWANIMGREDSAARIPFVVATGVLISCVYWLSLKFVVPLAFVWWAVAGYFVKAYPREVARWQDSGIMFVIGLFLLVPAWMALVMLQGQIDGSYWVMYLMFLVWGADTGAYFVGRAFGKAKLAPNVSPGKSVAGMYGGLATTFLIALGVSVWTAAASKVGIVAFLIVSMLAALASVLGDLAESMFKRHRGIKDSSQLLPGHGGILDRIDSITAAAPIFVGGM